MRTRCGRPLCSTIQAVDDRQTETLITVGIERKRPDAGRRGLNSCTAAWPSTLPTASYYTAERCTLRCLSIQAALRPIGRFSGTTKCRHGIFLSMTCPYLSLSLSLHCVCVCVCVCASDIRARRIKSGSNPSRVQPTGRHGPSDRHVMSIRSCGVLQDVRLRTINRTAMIDRRRTVVGNCSITVGRQVIVDECLQDAAIYTIYIYTI